MASVSTTSFFIWLKGAMAFRAPLQTSLILFTNSHFQGLKISKFFTTRTITQTRLTSRFLLIESSYKNLFHNNHVTISGSQTDGSGGSISGESVSDFCL